MSDYEALYFRVETDRGTFEVFGRNANEAREQIEEKFSYNATIWSIKEIERPKPVAAPVKPPQGNKR